MIELRRIKAGIFEEKDVFSVEEIEQAFEAWKETGNENKLKKILIPAEIISQIYPVVKVEEQEIKRLLNGKPLFSKDFKQVPEIFCVFNKDRFIGMYNKVNSSTESDEKSIIAKPKFIFS